MRRDELEQFVRNRRCTLLGVGPVSKNSVDAAIELAEEHSAPLMLIASRRQIDAKRLGGGYVNNWSTEEFSKYVAGKNQRGKILLARDHGGPWQNPMEIKNNLSLKHAMESAKHSYEVDIESGFDFVHIDTGIDIFTQPSLDETLQRAHELYEFCYKTAQTCKREILFEVGTDELGSNVQDLDQFEYGLSNIIKFCEKNNFPQPLFIVAQTGTKVMEMQNLGSSLETQVPRLLEICRKYNIWFKAHNTDYLSDELLRRHPELGIHAANVAPEFGVCESRTFVELLEQESLKESVDKFIELAYDSKKWDKWMLPHTQATIRDRAIISGHYVFADPRFAAIKAEAQQKLSKRGIDIDETLKKSVKASIFRYMKQFNLLAPQ